MVCSAKKPPTNRVNGNEAELADGNRPNYCGTRKKSIKHVSERNDSCHTWREFEEKFEYLENAPATVSAW